VLFLIFRILESKNMPYPDNIPHINVALKLGSECPPVKQVTKKSNCFGQSWRGFPMLALIAK